MQALLYVPMTLLLLLLAADTRAGEKEEEEEEAPHEKASSSQGEQNTRIFSSNPILATGTQGALLHVPLGQAGAIAQGLASIVNQAQKHPGRYPGHGHPGQGGHYPGHGHPGQGGHYPGHGQPGHGGHHPGHGQPGHGGHYPGQGGHYPGQGGHGHYPGQGGHYPGQGGHYPGQGGHYPGQGGHYPGQGGHYPGHGHPGHGGHYPGQGGHYPGHGSPCQDHSPSNPVVSCKYFCKNPCGELFCCDSSNNPYTTTQRPVIRPGKCPPARITCHDSLRLKPPKQCAHDGYCGNYNEKCCWDACLKFKTCKLADFYGK